MQIQLGWFENAILTKAVHRACTYSDHQHAKMHEGSKEKPNFSGLTTSAHSPPNEACCTIVGNCGIGSAYDSVQPSRADFHCDNSRVHLAKARQGDQAGDQKDQDMHFEPEHITPCLMQILLPIASTFFFKYRCKRQWELTLLHEFYVCKTLEKSNCESAMVAMNKGCH